MENTDFYGEWIYFESNEDFLSFIEKSSREFRYMLNIALESINRRSKEYIISKCRFGSIKGEITVDVIHIDVALNLRRTDSMLGGKDEYNRD